MKRYSLNKIRRGIFQAERISEKLANEKKNKKNGSWYGGQADAYKKVLLLLEGTVSGGIFFDIFKKYPMGSLKSLLKFTEKRRKND